MPTVHVLRPVSQQAKEWVDEHVQYESWNMMGEGIAIEHRYIGPIVEAMLNEGFINGQDFTVYS